MMITQSFNKTKLYKNNKAEIDKKYKSNLRTFWGWEFQKQNFEMTIFIFFLKIYTQRNDLNAVKVIFWDVMGCFIGVYNFKENY